jgi:hypothetical protein
MGMSKMQSSSDIGTRLFRLMSKVLLYKLIWKAHHSLSEMQQRVGKVDGRSVAKTEEIYDQ